jgi:hypothetical protein
MPTPSHRRKSHANSPSNIGQQPMHTTPSDLPPTTAMEASKANLRKTPSPWPKSATRRRHSALEAAIARRRPARRGPETVTCRHPAQRGPAKEVKRHQHDLTKDPGWLIRCQCERRVESPTVALLGSHASWPMVAFKDGKAEGGNGRW